MQVSVISTPKGAKRGDRAALERRHRLALAEPAVDREIDAARIGDGRHPHPPLRLAVQRRGLRESAPRPRPGTSVSAMMCACDTGTKSAASKNSPTAIWWAIAQRLGSPSSPASIAFLRRSAASTKRLSDPAIDRT